MTGRSAKQRATGINELLVGIAIGAAVAVIAYAAIRALERALFSEPNPATLIWSDQSPLAWRAAMALYVGGAAAFGGHALAARSTRAATRGLFAVTAAAVAAILVQGAIWP